MDSTSGVTYCACDDLDLDPEAVDRAEDIADLAGITDVVAFPDMGMGDQETPVSLATASDSVVYPQLSSNPINCGMAVLKTNLTRDEVDPDVFADISKAIHDRTYDKQFRPPTADMGELLVTGAEYVVERWDIESDVLDHIENNGNMFRDREPVVSVNEAIPPWLKRHHTHKELPYPPLTPNHFLEFQCVDEIVNDRVAADWGLFEDQLVCYLHGDYFFTLMVNWHYYDRLRLRNESTTRRLKYSLSRGAFHLLNGYLTSPRSLKHYYYNDKTYLGFDENSREGKRYITAHDMAMNYAYAGRLLSLLCTSRILEESVETSVEAELLWDVSHDSIQKERINGQDYWISRKGTGTVYPDTPALVTGNYNMNSALCQGRSGAENYLYSHDHGCGNVQDRTKSQPDRSHGKTHRYDLSTGEPFDEVDHVEPAPVETVIERLHDRDVLEQVAWFRPVANFAEQ